MIYTLLEIICAIYIKSKNSLNDNAMYRLLNIMQEDINGVYMELKSLIFFSGQLGEVQRRGKEIGTVRKVEKSQK
jgi:hypothetical protein